MARQTHPGGTGYERALYSIAEVPDDLKDTVEKKYLNQANGQAAVSLKHGSN